MKRSFLLCVVLLVSTGLFAQSNRALENTTWINGHYSLQFPGGGIPPQMILDWTRKYCTTTKDTLINGREYLKLFECSALSQYYRGALRADSLRWYFVARDSLFEMLLYDFGLNPGDTLNQAVFTEHYFSPPHLPYSCQAVDTIQVNGQNRRRLQIGGAFWIEGVGCTQGLLWDPEPNISNFALSLECYARWDSVGYASANYQNHHGSGAMGCDLSFSLDETLPSGGVTVYPNPSAGQFTLRFPHFNGKLAVSVFSFDGRKLFTTEAHQPELKLALNLPEGIYLLSYSGSDQTGYELFQVKR